MAPLFPLVVVVYADAEVRVARLVEHRGMAEDDARARIAAQASDEQRRAVADVWLDNSGSPEALAEQAVRCGITASRRSPPISVAGQVVRPPARAGAGRSGLARSGAPHRSPASRPHAGQRALRVDHIGSTAVPGLDAKDAIDIQVTVESLAAADELSCRLAVRRLSPHRRHQQRCRQAGRPQHRPNVLRPQRRSGVVAQADSWQSADPGRPTNVHVRVDGWPNQQFALLFVDWLTANPASRDRVPGRQARRGASSIARRTTSAAYLGRQGAMVSRPPTGGRGSGPTLSDGGRRLSGRGQRCAAGQYAIHRVGAACGWLDKLVDLRGDVVVNVDLAVHLGRIGPPNRHLHPGLLGVGQHRVGLESLPGIELNCAVLVWLVLVTKVAWLPGAMPSIRAM